METEISGGLGIGLNDLKSLFQPQQFYDSKSV